MKNINYAHWRQIYDENLANYRQKEKSKLLGDQLKTKDSTECAVCGQLVTDNEVEYHLLKHSEQVTPNAKYKIDLTFREANSKIKIEKLTFIPLFLNYYKGRYIRTFLNLLNVTDWYKLEDENGTTVRWCKVKSKLIRTLWLILVIITITFK